MDSEKEKNRLSDIVLERVGLTGNLLSRSEEHTSELQSPAMISYAVFCLMLCSMGDNITHGIESAKLHFTPCCLSLIHI